MSVDVPAYLRSYLAVADSLPERLDGVPVEEIENLQRRLRDLVTFAAHLDAQVAQLSRELDRAERRRPQEPA